MIHTIKGPDKSILVFCGIVLAVKKSIYSPTNIVHPSIIAQGFVFSASDFDAPKRNVIHPNCDEANKQ